MTLQSMLSRLSAVSAGSSFILAAAAAFLIAYSAPAFAQSDPRYPDSEAREAAPAQEMPGGMMGGRGMMGMMGACPMMGGAAHADGRIAFLKAELAISDTQKPAWETYAAALKKNLESMQGMRQAMLKVMQAKSPVERLDAHIAAMEGRLGALRELKPGLATLYASLSDDQKKKADEMLTGMGCMM